MQSDAAVGNAASLRVVTKLGFRYEALLRKARKNPTRRGRFDCRLYSIVVSDLRSARRRLVDLCGVRRPWG